MAQGIPVTKGYGTEDKSNKIQTVNTKIIHTMKDYGNPLTL